MNSPIIRFIISQIIQDEINSYTSKRNGTLACRLLSSKKNVKDQLYSILDAIGGHFEISGVRGLILNAKMGRLRLYNRNIDNTIRGRIGLFDGGTHVKDIFGRESYGFLCGFRMSMHDVVAMLEAIINAGDDGKWSPANSHGFGLQMGLYEYVFDTSASPAATAKSPPVEGLFPRCFMEICKAWKIEERIFSPGISIKSEDIFTFMYYNYKGLLNSILWTDAKKQLDEKYGSLLGQYREIQRDMVQHESEAAGSQMKQAARAPVDAQKAMDEIALAIKVFERWKGPSDSKVFEGLLPRFNFLWSQNPKLTAVWFFSNLNHFYKSTIIYAERRYHDLKGSYNKLMQSLPQRGQLKVRGSLVRQPTNRNPAVALALSHFALDKGICELIIDTEILRREKGRPPVPSNTILDRLLLCKAEVLVDVHHRHDVRHGGQLNTAISVQEMSLICYKFDIPVEKAKSILNIVEEEKMNKADGEKAVPDQHLSTHTFNEKKYREKPGYQDLIDLLSILKGNSNISKLSGWEDNLKYLMSLEIFPIIKNYDEYYAYLNAIKRDPNQLFILDEGTSSDDENVGGSRIKHKTRKRKNKRKSKTLRKRRKQVKTIKKKNKRRKSVLKKKSILKKKPSQKFKKTIKRIRKKNKSKRSQK